MKIKDFIYKYSIRLFILIVAYLIVSFPFQYTQEKMNDVSQPVRWLGTLLLFIIACFIVRYRKKLETVFAKKSLFFIIFVMIFALQLMTIYVFKIQPVNDAHQCKRTGNTDILCRGFQSKQSDHISDCNVNSYCH